MEGAQSPHLSVLAADMRLQVAFSSWDRREVAKEWLSGLTWSWINCSAERGGGRGGGNNATRPFQIQSRQTHTCMPTHFHLTGSQHVLTNLPVSVRGFAVFLFPYTCRGVWGESGDNV